MMRQAARGALALLLVAAVLDSAGRGQTGTGDKLYYRDKKDKKERTAEGELKLTPAGLQVVAGGKVSVTVSPADVVKVVPGELPGMDRLKDVLPPLNLEDKREWDKARAAYAAFQKANPNPPDKTRRYLEYKLGTLAARVADEARDEDGWEAKAKDAVGQLERFVTAYPNGWELWGVGRTLARLQGELGRWADAESTWSKLARNAEMPTELKVEAGLQELDAAIRAGRATDVGPKAAELAKTATSGPAKDRLAIYRAAAEAIGKSDPAGGVAAVEKLIADSKDPAVRATGYGMLGELYLADKKPREAMWSFLWVEVVYTQDRDEVLKAVARLVTCFKQQGDEEREKAYREKLRRYRTAL